MNQQTLIDISTGIALVTDLLANAQKISSLIQQATAAGSLTLSAEQWAQIVGDRDSAEAGVLAAIAKAKAAAPGAAP